MKIHRSIATTILIVAAFERPPQTASAHPGSGIVVDQDGQVFFQDSQGGAIWKIDTHGKLTKYYDKMGGHWMALDSAGSFSRIDLKLVKRITPFASRPTLLVADGGAPLVVNPDGNLYHGHDLLEGGRVEVGITRISPDGTQTLFSPDLKKLLVKMNDGVMGLATGPDGSVYVSAWNAVLKVDREGAVTTIVHPVVVSDCDEDPADHNPADHSPHLRGLAVDAEGTIFAAATSCHRLLKITPDGKTESVLKAERPWSPTGVAEQDGDVYVLEYTHANGGRDEGWLPRVRKLGRDGKVTILAAIDRQRH